MTRSRTGPWIGICEPLKLTTQADTWSELMTDISWAMEAVFEDLPETGDLEQFLRERGWTTRPLTPRKPGFERSRRSKMVDPRRFSV